MGPNITGNPLPNHPEPKINALNEDYGLKVKSRIDEIEMCMDNVFEMLVQAQLFQARKRGKVKEGEQSEEVSSQYCKYHNDCMGYTIQECTEFRMLVQILMDRKEMEFSEKSEEQFVDVITGVAYSENLS